MSGDGLVPPLSVRLYNDNVDVNITPLLSNLRYRAVVPGGYASADLTFRRPLSVRRPEVAAFTRAVVYDTGTGETTWEGDIEDPGPENRADGQVWQLTAMGGSARAGDITTPRHYIESDPSAFDRRSRQVAAATGEVGDTPSGNSDQAIVITIPGGAALGAGVVKSLFYDRLVQSAQQVGGVGYSRVAGKTDANYQNNLSLIADDGVPATETPVSQNWSTVAAAVAAKVVGTDWTVGMDTVRFSVNRSGGATTVADDTSWGAFYDLYVAARRMDATGAFVTNSDHNRAYVLASEVFADLIGAGLLPFDGTTAAIAASSHHIDQLTYPDGATAQQMLDDCLAFDPASYWAAWEGSPPRCEFTTWATTPTYIVGVDDGYEAPQSSADLYDQVKVRWVDGRGRTQTLYDENLTFGILVERGVHRRALLDLGSDIGSDANAAKIAANFLTDHAYPPNGGTLTLRRPVLDLRTGRLTPPHRIVPGTLAAINGVDAYPDALNGSGPDGRAVVRVISTEYDTASNSVSCELDSYSRALARSLRRARRRRPNG